MPLLTLLGTVGGCGASEEVTVTSADGFSITYTSELLTQITDGTYPMERANGTPVVTTDRYAQPIVAYEVDIAGDGSTWKPLDAGTGPLRMALITDHADRVNQGKYNPFMVVSIEVTASK